MTFSVILQPIAQMAELVDATDSKSVVRKGVQVRFLFWAQKNLWIYSRGFCLNATHKIMPSS